MGRYSPTVLPSGINPFAEMLDRGHDSFDRHRGQRQADEEREWARKRMERLDAMERERFADDQAWQELEAEDWFRERGGQRGERPPGEPSLTEGAGVGMQPPTSERTEHTPFGPFGTGQLPDMGMGDATGTTGHSPVGDYLRGEDIHRYVPVEAGRFSGYVARPGVQEAEQREAELSRLTSYLAALTGDEGRSRPAAGLMQEGAATYGQLFPGEEEAGPPARYSDEWFGGLERELALRSRFRDSGGGGGGGRGRAPTYAQAMDELKDYYYDPETDGYHLSMREMDRIARAMAEGEEPDFPDIPGERREGAPDMRGPFPTEEPASGFRAFFERLIPGGETGMEPEYDMESVEAQPPGGRRPPSSEGSEPPPTRNVSGRREAPPGEGGEAGGEEGVELSAEEIEQAREILSQFPREEWEEILQDEGATPSQIAQIVGG